MLLGRENCVIICVKQYSEYTQSIAVGTDSFNFFQQSFYSWYSHGPKYKILGWVGQVTHKRPVSIRFLFARRALEVHLQCTCNSLPSIHSNFGQFGIKSVDVPQVTTQEVIMLRVGLFTICWNDR